MRGAVAVAFGLLPLMLLGSRPVAAQEPLRVIRELRFEGNRAIPDEAGILWPWRCLSPTAA